MHHATRPREGRRQQYGVLARFWERANMMVLYMAAHTLLLPHLPTPRPGIGGDVGVVTISEEVKGAVRMEESAGSMQSLLGNNQPPRWAVVRWVSGRM